MKKRFFSILVCLLTAVSLSACSLSEVASVVDTIDKILTTEEDGNQESNVSSNYNVENKSETTVTTSDKQPEAKKYTFRNNSLFVSHYEKHGIEMGFATKEDYLEAANAVVNNPKALHKLEKEDGDDIYYIEETNEFVVVSKDGYIRTYFLPDSGIKYYNKQ